MSNLAVPAWQIFLAAAVRTIPFLVVYVTCCSKQAPDEEWLQTSWLRKIPCLWRSLGYEAQELQWQATHRQLVAELQLLALECGVDCNVVSMTNEDLEDKIDALYKEARVRRTVAQYQLFVEQYND
jgi:hypothetical protein